MHHRLAFLICSAAFVIACTTKRGAITEAAPEQDTTWAAIDSLRGIGQYQSALARTLAVLDNARVKGDQLLEFRAMMTMADLQQMTGEEDTTIIRAFEQRARTAHLPLSALLHSMIGEQYWAYYRDNRWEIMDRTELQEETGDDISTWSQSAFMRKVIDEYRASLVDADSLKGIGLDRMGWLIHYDVSVPQGNADVEKERGLKLRPTLFDLLAHRALAIFRNTETRVAEPATRFHVQDPRYFSLFEDFTALRLTHADSMSWELQALKLYQQLERFHLNDTEPDALVDNALGRLAYVRGRCMRTDRDSLYLNALITLGSRLPNDTCLGDVLMAQARWHREMGERYQRLSEGGTTEPPWKWERKQALTFCDTVLARYAGSYAAIQAADVREGLVQSELSLRVEDAVLPNAPFRVAVEYRNAPKIRLRLVKDDWSTDEYLQNDGRSDGEKLVERKALREWTVVLPDDGDLNQHLTEVAVDGLPLGHYAILVSDTSTFMARKDEIAFARFWVTRLAMTQRWKHGDLDLLVVDRGTGVPKQGVGVVSWTQDYRTGGNYKRSLQDLVTGPDGFMRTRLSGERGSIGWELLDGDDRFVSTRTWIPDDRGAPEEESTRIHLFTDRAIYRPGQPVMFKGIVTRRSGKSTTTVTDFRTSIELFDVNGEKVDSLSVTSDAYGSFHGSFIAPQGTLTGSMTLRTPHGSKDFQVEEYKRPTFELVFDPIAGQPQLGREVSVTGLAKSYAGAPLDGARVRWTVRRSAFMPWWGDRSYRGWLPWDRSTQVAEGESACDAHGKFAVRFKAEADDLFPNSADPRFHFSVDASVTDISGETQSSGTSLSLGYTSIDIVVGLGKSLDRTKADSVLVRTVNLNGERVDVPMDVRVFKLQAPPTPMRERLWVRPDRFTLTREEHAARFPQDVYADETDPLTWTRATEVLHEPGFVPGARGLSLREARSWEVGIYLMEVITKDESGAEVKAKRVFTVFDPAIQNTGFTNEACHTEPVHVRVEPGDKAQLLLSTALPEAHILMEVERDGHIAVSRWFTLKRSQQLIELPVKEEDRGGFTVHFLCVERGLAHQEDHFIDVPWTNKELKVEWMSFRDKLLPGSQEEWRMRITGSKGEKVAAQLLAGMYDASLDHFIPHGWELELWHRNGSELAWRGAEPFGVAEGQQIWWEGRRGRYGTYDQAPARIYPMLDDFGYDLREHRKRRRFRQAEALYDMAPAATFAMGAEDGDTAGALAFTPTKKGKPEEGIAQAATEGGPSTQTPPIRSDFRETAFFLPDLLTDRDGGIVLRFKTPDALTRWKVMGLAHTKELQLARFTRGTVTQKPLMVVPNLPRFLRSGDRITLTAKINVMEPGRAEGLASLELFDPYTNALLNKVFGVQVKDKSFVAAMGESAVVEWEVVVPEGVDVCGVRINAESKGGPGGGIVAADGEERALPVLTDKLLVTESVALWSGGKGAKTFKLPNLLASAGSSTLRSQSLKLEYTPNPAWYAVQALPYLMEFPHECAEQIFSRYYANRLASHIVQERPAIKQVFEQWKQAGPEAFAGKLEKNPDLKNVLLAETPWVVNARSERESRQRIGLLFDLARMGAEEAGALKKLRDMQLGSGAWPWWSGMGESRWITQHIVAGLGHLEQLRATGRGDGQTQAMLKNAVDWLDRDLVEDHERMTKRMSKEELEKYHPGYTEIHYLYARSFYTRWPLEGAARTVADFHQERAARDWLSYGLQEQAMLALALHRFGDRATPALILESLRQRATMSEELGMYWKDFTGGMEWNSFPAETHALMIEAFDLIEQDARSVNALRTYLLRLKQTTDWKTTKATAEACYVLLLTGADWLDEGEAPVISVGNETVKADKQEAGTGAIEQSWVAAAIKPGMGTVTVTSKSDKPSWGALHWQYFERMDKVKPHESPFSLKKQVFLTRQTEQGPKLEAIGSGIPLKPGDKLTVRIELRTDRYVDFVHMKDLRAAGLEPTETLSGYKYQGGLGYYQSIRDASTNFFFDRIAPGTYVFEYPLHVTHAGEFSNGITTAMCMYAPEFSSHSEGIRLMVNGE